MKKRKLSVLFSGLFAMVTVLVSFSSVGFAEDAQDVSITISTTQKIKVEGDGADFWFCVELENNGQLKKIWRSSDECKENTAIGKIPNIAELQKPTEFFKVKERKGGGVKNIFVLPYNSFIVTVEGNTSTYCSPSACY